MGYPRRGPLRTLVSVRTSQPAPPAPVRRPIEDTSWTRSPAPTSRPRSSRSATRLFVPDLLRHHRPGGDRHQQALRRNRHVHLRPGLHLDRQLRVQDHLHRRRSGRAAVPRRADRAVGRARRLPGDLLSAALRRASDRDPKGRFRLPRHAPHHGARADEPVLPGLPARRAPDGGDDRLRSARCRRSITTPPTSPIRISAWSPRSA